MSSNLLLRRTLLGSALLALPLVAACTEPDPQGRFDDFADRVAPDVGGGDAGDSGDAVTDGSSDPGDGGTDPDCEVPPLEPQGDYLLAIRAAPFATFPPVMVRTTITRSGELINFSFQPITADTDFDENFEPVPRPDAERRVDIGDAVVANDVAVAADGSFTVVITNLDVSGETNPITGSDLVGDLTLVGTFANSDTACGTVPEGTVTGTTEVNMTNSTWAMVRLDGDPKLIEPVPSKCADLTIPDPCAGEGSGDGSGEGSGG